MLTRKFSFRLGNIEIRSCNKILTSKGDHVTAEIVEWLDHDSTCFTIAYFKNTTEGFEMKFILDRPVRDSVNWVDLGVLIRKGYELLESYSKR